MKAYILFAVAGLFSCTAAHAQTVGYAQAIDRIAIACGADAIHEALVTTFRVPPANVEAVGLGEEQLRDSSHPDAAANRRVQIVTIGKR